MAGARFDPTIREFFGAPKKDTDMDERGLGWVFFDAMQRWSQEKKIAQVDALTGKEDTYENLLLRSIRTALALQQRGLQRGDIISICSTNHEDAIVPLIAGQFLGLLVAPLDPILGFADTKYLMKLVKPRIIFVSPECEEVVQKVLNTTELNPKVVSFDQTTDKYTTFDEYSKQQDGEKDFKPADGVDPKRTCLILFSSGTTGLPKGICLNHYFVQNCINGMAAMDNIGTTFFGYASLYWISAIMTVSSCLALGYKKVLCREYDPEYMWDHIEKYNVDFLFIAPVQAIKAIPYMGFKGKNLKNMMIGGGSVAARFIEDLRKVYTDTFIAVGYGQTEIGFISGLKDKDDNYYKLDTCGQPVPGLAIKIVNPETGIRKGIGKVGEIRVKSKYVLNGYYNQDSSDVWDEEGYVRTGDLGYFDSDCCLYITDRIKEMFKFNSYHILPAQLELILQSHPAVELAVVVGVPHPTEDNHALGVVTLCPGALASAKEIERFVNARVEDRNRLRAGVIILKYKDLPMTPSGKIKRRELKELIVQRLRIRA